MLGADARKIISKYDHEYGKIIGEAKINGSTEKVKARLARFFLNTINSVNMDVDDVMALIDKAKNKK